MDLFEVVNDIANTLVLVDISAAPFARNEHPTC